MRKGQKSYRKWLAILIALFVFVTAIPMPTEAAETTIGTYGELTYEIVDGEVAITDCSLDAVSVDIPTEIDGYPVVQIGKDAFQYCKNLTSITIPEGVTSIGSMAFWQCTALSTITMPKSVKQVFQWAFNGCHNIQDVYVPDLAAWCNIEFNDDNSNPLSNSANLWIDGKKIEGKLEIPEGRESILDYTFNGLKNITEIILPEGITRIGNFAFANCENLTSITIPKSVTYIDASAFGACDNLQDVYASDIITWCNIKFESSAANPLLYSDNFWVEGKKVEGKLEIPEGIEEIYAFAFYGCKSITEVILPKGITQIGEYAFWSCSNLKNIQMQEGITTIGESAFERCESLESIEIPEGVTSIATCAFQYCASLKSVTFPKSINRIYRYAFYMCENLEDVYAADLTSWCAIDFDDDKANPLLYSDNFWADGKKVEGKLQIPEGIRTIQDFSFYNLNSITEIILPSSVGEIRQCAFASCTNLKKVQMQEGLKSIRERAFYECWKLAEIHVPKGVRSIDSSAFGSCPELTKCLIGEVPNDEYFGLSDYAFSSSPNVVLYSHMSRVKDYARENNIPYFDEHVYKSVADIQCLLCDYKREISENFKKYENLFYSVKDEEVAIIDCLEEAEHVVIPDEIEGYPVTSIEKDAFLGCYKLKSIVLSNKLKQIGSCAFFGCDSLENITIPRSVKAVGERAFSYISEEANVYYKGDLKDWCGIEFGASSANPLYRAENVYIDGEKIEDELVIPKGVASIGAYAFGNCRGLKSVEFSETVTSIGKMAFEKCTQVTDVFYEGDLKSWCAIEFQDTYANPVLTKTNLYISGEKLEGDLVIPDGTTAIKAYTFQNRLNLTSVSIPASVERIGESAFVKSSYIEDLYYLGTLKEWCAIDFGDATANPMYYADNVYMSGEILNGTLAIPEGVTHIGRFAFYGFNSCANVIIPKSVVSIGEDAFERCSEIIKVYYEGDFKSWCLIAFENRESNPMCKSEIDYIDGQQIQDEFIVPKDVERIEQYTLSSTTINIIEIPIGVKFIDEKAFDGYYGLKKVKTPCEFLDLFTRQTYLEEVILCEGATYIADEAFYNCKKLKNITIPKTVRSIGDSAFTGCKVLENVYYEGDMASWCEMKFTNYTSNPLSYAKNVYVAGQKLEGEIVIPDQVTIIDDYAFYGGKAITKFIISDSVKQIGNYAFSSIKSLTDITIPKNVMSIGKGAFSSCTGLVNIIISDGVTSIGERAFSSCYALTEIVIPDSVTEIGEKTFYNCDELVRAVLSKNTTYVVTRMFEDCDKLIDVTIPEGITTIGEQAFAGCYDLESVTIPSSVTEIGNGAFSYSDNLRNIILPAGVTRIGKEAFRDCEKLTSVTVFEGVTEIGDEAFYDCYRIASIFVPESVTNIGKNAFHKGTKLHTQSEYVIEYATNNGYKYFKEHTYKHHKCQLCGYERKKASVQFENTLMKTEYCINQRLNLAGYTITIIYDDGTTEKVTTGYNVTGFDSSKVGECIINVEYFGETASYKININPHEFSDQYDKCVNCVQQRTCEKLSVKDMPNKTTYCRGEDLDTTGLVLTAEYDNGTITTISSGYKIKNFNSPLPGKFSVMVEYKGVHTTFDVTINTHVYDSDSVDVCKQCKRTRRCSKVSVLNNPNKTTYYLGQQLETDGLALLSTYTDGTVKVITTGYSIRECSFERVGTKKVEVLYNGKSTYFDVIIKEPTMPAKVTTELYGYDDVKISWSKSIGANYYYVYYKRSTRDKFEYLGMTTKTYYQKANLADGVKYEFQIVPTYINNMREAIKGVGKTSSIYTLKKVSKPTVKRSSSKVKISWKNINGESGYQISKATSKSKTKIVSTYETTSGKTKKISAKKGKKYYYKVRAYKTVNGKKIYGPWSSVVAYKVK